MLTSAFALHLPFGRDNHTLALNQAPMVLGLFFLTTDELVLAALVGLGFVQLVVRRNPPIKLAFNMASMLAQVPLACLVFAAMLDLFNVQAERHDAAGLAGDADRGADRRRARRRRRLRHHQPAQRAWDLAAVPRTLGIVALGTFVVTDLALVTVLRDARVPAGAGAAGGARAC